MGGTRIHVVSDPNSEDIEVSVYPDPVLCNP